MHLLSSISCLNACTGLKLNSKDGSTVHGRTLEFGIKIDVTAVVVPRNFPFMAMTELGSGLAYKSKYAVLGSIAYDTLAVLDGINEKGLSVGAFYFEGFAEYTPVTKENQSRALSPFDLPNWILTQFATVDEVKAALNQIVLTPIIVKEWGSSPIPLHYIVYDKAGNALVIEPLKGKIVTYDNPLGVLTNSPNFDWHMTNLRNYIQLSPNAPEPRVVDGLTFKPMGLGAGMTGLPGDFSPPSRFVRATIFSKTAIPEDNANGAIFQAFHLLNQFDVPKGAAREIIDSQERIDYTMFTCVKDPQALKLYFKTYENQNIRVIDLSKFDFNAKAVKKYPITGEGGEQDISSMLK